MSASPLMGAEFRLAQYYLRRLDAAADAVRRGHASLLYGFNLFDQEAHHIQRWHAVVAERSSCDAEWARLCKEYPLVGREVLVARLHAAEYRHWLERALAAAQQLDDRKAERAILHELSITHYRLGALDTLEQVACRLLASGEAADDQLSIGRGREGLGRVAEERGMYAEASRHYQQALQVFQRLGARVDVGHALNGLGSVAFYSGDYLSAYRYFARQLKLMRAQEKSTEYCSALLAVGDTLVRLKDFARAEATLHQAVNLCRTLGFRRLLGMGLLTLGSVATAQNQLELAALYFGEGLEEVRAVGVQRQIISGLAWLGWVQLRQGDAQAALATLIEGRELARQSRLPRYLCIVQRNLAYTHLALDHPDDARLALQESLWLAWELNLAPETAQALTCALAYSLHLGFCAEAAVWAGALRDNPCMDAALFAGACSKLERVLTPERYHEALTRGRGLRLDRVVQDVLARLSAPGSIAMLT